MNRIAAVTALLLAGIVAAPSAEAAGGRQQQNQIEPAEPMKSAEDQATDHYNFGLVYRDKAWMFEEKAAAATDEKARVKLGNKAQKQYKRAIQEFELAVGKNPAFHQAYSSLGYALRKTAQFEDSLAAYDRALDLEPSYAEAIEYRAEAYLGLNRLAEAKDAYIELFGAHREYADELLDAMKVWVEQRRRDPAGVEGSTLDDLESWIADREEIAGQTASISELRERDW